MRLRQNVPASPTWRPNPEIAWLHNLYPRDIPRDRHDKDAFLERSEHEWSNFLEYTSRRGFSLLISSGEKHRKTESLSLQGKQNLAYSLITGIWRANHKARNAMTGVRVHTNLG